MFAGDNLQESTNEVRNIQCKDGGLMSDIPEQIYAMLRESPKGIPEMARALYKERRVTYYSMRSLLQRHLNVMYNDGKIDRTGSGSTKDPYVFSLKEES